MVLRYTFRVFRLFFSTCLQDYVRKLEMITQKHMHFLSLVNEILQLPVLLQSLYRARSSLPRVRNQLFGMSDFPGLWMASNSLLRLVSCLISNIDACSQWNSQCSFLWCRGSPVSVLNSVHFIFKFALTLMLF